MYKVMLKLELRRRESILKLQLNKNIEYQFFHLSRWSTHQELPGVASWNTAKALLNLSSKNQWLTCICSIFWCPETQYSSVWSPLSHSYQRHACKEPSSPSIARLLIREEYPDFWNDWGTAHQSWSRWQHSVDRIWRIFATECSTMADERETLQMHREA